MRNMLRMFGLAAALVASLPDLAAHVTAPLLVDAHRLEQRPSIRVELPQQIQIMPDGDKALGLPLFRRGRLRPLSFYAVRSHRGTSPPFSA